MKRFGNNSVQFPSPIVTPQHIQLLRPPRASDRSHGRTQLAGKFTFTPGPSIRQRLQEIDNVGLPLLKTPLQKQSPLFLRKFIHNAVRVLNSRLGECAVLRVHRRFTASLCTPVQNLRRLVPVEPATKSIALGTSEEE